MASHIYIFRALFIFSQILLLKSLLLLEHVHSAVEKRAQAAATAIEAEKHGQLKMASKLKHKPAVESPPTIYDLVMRCVFCLLDKLSC